MKYILYVLLGIMIVACGDSKNADSKDSMNNNTSSVESKFDFMSLGDVEHFYLLKGDDNKSVIYLNIAKNRDTTSNAIAEIFGKYVFNDKQYTLEAKVFNSTSPITFDISDDKDSTSTHAFEGVIFDNGAIEANMLDKRFGKDKILFTPSSDTINHILFPTETIEQKYMGKDYDDSPKEYTFSALKQAAFIDNANTQSLQKINESFGGNNIDVIRQALKDDLQKEFDDEKGETNYESIDSLEVEYIDKKILVLNKYSYIYSGGAHGNYGNEMVAFDLSTGERLPNTISSLLKDENDKELKAMVIDKLKKIITIDNANNLRLSMFRIDPCGVEFYWGLYEIAPYADGIISIRFSFNELAKFVKEDSPYYYLFNKNV